MTDIIAEIAAASQEQSTGIDQVNQAVTQMDAGDAVNAAQTEELSSTAQSLAGQAEQLQTGGQPLQGGQRGGPGQTGGRAGGPGPEGAGTQSS